MIDLLIIVIYFLVLIAIGYITSSKVTTFKDYALGYKKYSYLVIMATLSASFLGGGFTMGISSKVYAGSLIAVIGILGFSAKELIVAKVFAKRFAAFKEAISIGDIMQTQYGKHAKVITGILSLIVCAGIVGAQINALGYVSAEFFNIEQETAVIIGCVLLTAYTIMGGLSAIILTDVIQFIILIIGIPLLCIMGLIHIGGIEPLLNTGSVDTNIMNPTAMWSAIALFLSFLFGETFVPPYIQRLMIGETTSDSEKGTFLSGLLSIPIFLLSGLIGLIALYLIPNIDASMAMPSLMNIVLPVGLKGLIVAGLLSAIMSTADSFLQAGAVSFVHDTVKPIVKIDKEKTELLIFRLCTAAISIAALVAALKVKNLIDLCLYAWTFWSPIMLVPLAAVVLQIKVSKKHFYIPATIAGLIAYSYSSLLLGVLFSFISFVGLKLIDRSSHEDTKPAHTA